MAKIDCNLGLNNALDEISKRVADIKAEGPVLSKIDKELLKDTLDIIKKNVKDQLVEGDRELLDEALASTIKGRAKREILDAINTLKASKENVEFFETQAKGLTKASHIKNALKSFFERTYRLTTNEGERFGKLVDNAFDRIDTGGVRSDPEVNIRAKQMFQSETAGGNKLRKFLEEQGVTDVDREIYMALKQGTSKIRELDVLARAFKFIDTESATRVKELAPYFNILEGHVVPARINPDKVRANGFEDFKQDILEFADISSITRGKEVSPERLDELIQGIYEATAKATSFTPTSKFKSTTSLLGNRKIHFKSAETEYAYLQKYGDLERGILSSALNHRRNLLKQTVLHNIHGADVGYSMSRLTDAAAGKLKESPEIVKNLIDKQSKILQRTVGYASEPETIGDYIISGISSVISAGFTGSSTIRNLVYDNTVNTGLVSSFYKEGSAVLESAEATWGFVRHAVGKSDFDEISDLLELQGLSIGVSQNVLNKGILSDTLAAGSGEGLAAGFSKVANLAAEGVSKYSAADWSYKAARTQQALNVGSMIMKSFGNKWSELPTAFRVTLENMGFDQKSWALIDKVKRVKYKDKDLMVDINRFGELSDADVKPFMKDFETPKDAKRRIQLQYENLHNEILNEFSAIVTNRANLLAGHGEDSKLIKGLLALTLKFSNIALSQYLGMTRAAAKAAGMNPNRTSLWALDIWNAIRSKRPDLLGKVLVGAAYAGVMGTWITDIIKGDTPRDLSPEMLVDAFDYTGIGGVLSLVNARMIYSDDIVGTPLSGVIRPAKDVVGGVAEGKPEKAGRGAARLSKKLVPGTDLWYTRAAYDVLLRKGMGLEESSFEKRRRKELGQEKIID